MYIEHHPEDDNDSNSIVFEINKQSYLLKQRCTTFKSYGESNMTMVTLISSW